MYFDFCRQSNVIEMGINVMTIKNLHEGELYVGEYFLLGRQKDVILHDVVIASCFPNGDHLGSTILVFFIWARIPESYRN